MEMNFQKTKAMEKDNKTMMKLVVVTEAFFFISLIMAFVYMAYNSGFEPYELKALDIRTSGIFTVFLLSSSFTFWRAEKNYERGKIRNLKLWLVATIVLGTVFLFGQG